MSERDLQAKHRASKRPSATGRLSEKTVEMVAATLRVLADPTRIRLIEVLNERGGDTVSALTVCVRSSQQNVSKQLSVLHQAGIVSRRREGVWVRYQLADWTGIWLIEQLAAALGADPDESR